MLGTTTFINDLPGHATLFAAEFVKLAPVRSACQGRTPMGDIVEGRWQTPEERASMRALDGEIVRLTRVIEALRAAHACERASRSRRTGEIITFSTVRTTTNA